MDEVNHGSYEVAVSIRKWCEYSWWWQGYYALHYGLDARRLPEMMWNLSGCVGEELEATHV